MRVGFVSLVVLISVAGCKAKSEAPVPAPAVAAPAAPAPVVAPAPIAPPPAADPAPAAPAQALSQYLGAASVAKVYAVTANPTGGGERRLERTLTEAETKAYLAKVGLEQKADGPLVRCPSDKAVVVEDAAGKVLGTFGFCGGAARFDAPDGTFGGIRAELP